MAPASPVNVRDSWIDTAQGRLFLRQWAPTAAKNAPPIILFHDSLGSVELWRDFPAQLCRQTGHPVVAYDRLGFGRSDRHPGTLPLDFVAREAAEGFAALRQHLGLGPFILFGHSVGGGMAVNSAAHWGADCVALITESAQAFVEDRTVQGIEAAREDFKNPEQFRRLEKYHGEKARWVLDAWINAWLSEEFSGWSLKPALPRVTCPVLAIHGSDDEYGSPRHPQLIGELSSGPSRIEVMSGLRHVPHREQEAAVVALVADFLRSLG